MCDFMLERNLTNFYSKAGLNVKDGKYAWTIPLNLVKAPCYGLRIYLDSNPSTFEYSYPFQITFTKASSAAPVVVAPVVSTTAPVATKEASPASSNAVPVSQEATTLQTVINDVTKISISSSVIVLVSSAS